MTARLLALSCAAFIALTACAKPADPNAPPTDASYAAHAVVLREVHAGGGIACDVCNPGASRERTEPEYLVSDLGKPDVPRLTPDENEMLRAIRHYVRSKTLRFVKTDSDFLVFDAVDGPCTGSSTGYYILNLTSCNQFYSPSNDGEISMPDCLEPRRPWLAETGGQGFWPSPPP